MTYNASLADYPDGVTLEISTGDGQVIQLDLSGETNLTFVLNITDPGEFQGSVSFSNLATSVESSMEVRDGGGDKFLYGLSLVLRRVQLFIVM